MTAASASPPGAARGATDVAWYALSPAEALGRLEVDSGTGLTTAEAEARRTTYGANTFAQAKKASKWQLFVRQYADPMQIVLLVAGIVCLFLPGQFNTGVFLLLLTLFNAWMAMNQEGKAEASASALQSMMVVKAKVRRDGNLAEIPMDQLVPGDIVNIEAGDLVPADARILSAATLEIDESALTGESVPTPKQVDAVAADAASRRPHRPAWARGALAGERRLVDLERGRAQDPAVGRDQVARLDVDDVARDELLHRDLDDSSPRRTLALTTIIFWSAATLASALPSWFRPGSVEQGQEDQDDARGELAGQEQADDAGDEQDDLHRVGVLAQEPRSSMPSSPAANFRAVGRAARLVLGARQAGAGVDLELCRGLAPATIVPGDIRRTAPRRARALPPFFYRSVRRWALERCRAWESLRDPVRPPCAPTGRGRAQQTRRRRDRRRAERGWGGSGLVLAP